MTQKQRIQVSHLIEEFSRTSVIRPMDVFDMNYATATSVYGIVLTYIIVLLQFKLSNP